MRFFLHVSLILTTFLLFLGCAKTNAFSRFHLSTEKEHAISSLRSSKISRENDLLGVVSSIYLNEVNPKKYSGMEYFLVEVYTKNKDRLYNPNSVNEGEIVLKLNDELPIKIKKLDQENEFVELMAFDNKSWKSYYLVAFKESKSNKLSLILQDGNFGSLPLIYQKNEQ